MANGQIIRRPITSLTREQRLRAKVRRLNKLPTKLASAPKGVQNQKYWSYVLSCLNLKLNPLPEQQWQASINPASKRYDPRVVARTPKPKPHPHPR